MINLPLLTKKKNWKGVRVVLRCDLNVPIGDDGVISSNEATRIHASLKTISWLIDRGARVIVISHIGRDPEESLTPVHTYMAQHIDIGFIPDIVGVVPATMIRAMKEGSAVLLENIRSDPREKENDIVFASEIAGVADVFVNDAFAVCHREHASIVGIPSLLPSYIGFQLQTELENLDKLIHPIAPFVLILGGSKFGTKLPLLKKYIKLADIILLGGALAHPIMKGRGVNIGKSLSDNTADIKFLINSEKIITPEIVVVKRGDDIIEINVDAIEDNDFIVDIGITGVRAWVHKFANARSILWNGPLGWYEDGYTNGSELLIQGIAKNGGLRVVGGGDSVSLVEALKIQNAFDFISTGGGAMLEYLATGTLIGLEAIIENQGE